MLCETANKVSHQTVQRLLHREGYRYFHSSKKGLLTEKDLQQRLKFAHKVPCLLPKSFWRRRVALHLDGASFQHKYNLHDEAKSMKTMTWHRQDEGLLPGCTAKSSHCGSGGRVARFYCHSMQQGGHPLQAVRWTHQRRKVCKEIFQANSCSFKTEI